MTTDTNILAQNPLFSTLPQGELENLASNLIRIDVPPGSILIHEGERGDFFYIIRTGQVEIVKDLGTENERVLDRHGSGDFVGEMGLLNPDGLRTASVRTIGETSLWELSREDFNTLLIRFPLIAFEMIKVLSWRLSNTQKDVITDLKRTNRELLQAYEELKAAQKQIIEKEKLERELQMAQEIQLSILPQELPSLHGYSFGARFLPARMVGGDFYDLIPLDKKRMGVLIGDVTDKGMPAAIYMARAHALLRAEALRGHPPGNTLQVVNQHLLEFNHGGLFVTVLYGILDSADGSFSYARAGHELPVMCNTDGDMELLPLKPGQPLGIFIDPLLDENKVQVKDNCTLLLYTDGVTDIQDPNGNIFLEEGLLEILKCSVDLNGQETSDFVLETILRFRANAEQVDDITILAVHRD